MILTPELNKLAEENPKIAQKLLCEGNLKYLCTKVLGMNDWDTCHDKLYDFLVKSQKRKKMILMARGHLKSSIVTAGYVIQKILQNPNITILLNSEVSANAKSFLHVIKEYLTVKSDLAYIYGKFESEVWNTDEIVVKQRKRAEKSKTVETSGQDKAKVSQHYDLIITDDLVNRQTVNTMEQIEKTRKNFSDSLDLLNPNGEMIVIGTRWHDSDIYGEIKTNFKDEFDIFEMKAIEDGQITFPKKFSFEILKELEKLKGSYDYNAQYMLDPVPYSSSHFKPPIRYWNEIPQDVGYMVTVDLAISEKTNADYTVVMVTAKNKHRQMFVVEYARDHMTPAQTIDKVFEFVVKYGKSAKVGIESIAYQKAMIYLLQDEMKRRNFYFMIEPIISSKDKFSKIIALQPLWEQGNILLKQGMVELEDELQRFPVSRHDDLIDALSMTLMIDSGSLSYGTKAKSYIPERFKDQNEVKKTFHGGILQEAR